MYPIFPLQSGELGPSHFLCDEFGGWFESKRRLHLPRKKYHDVYLAFERRSTAKKLHSFVQCKSWFTTSSNLGTETHHVRESCLLEERHE